MIPYGRQSIDERDIREVVKVLESDYITQGPRVKEFEDAICRYTGAKYAVCVSSGTAALHIACLAAEIGKGDEVITSPMTFVASANCVLYCGGRPVFADIDPGTANIDAAEIERKINKKTRALIPVHYGGLPCDMAKIRKVAKKNNLIIIEDACHALGAKYKDGKNPAKVGSSAYSDMTVFSFHPVKHITTGEGGAVVTNDRSLYGKLLMLRTHGITKDCISKKNEGGWYYEMQLLGYNYRMTDIQASLGRSQLKKADLFLEKRRRIARHYDEAFSGNAYFSTPPSHRSSSYHLYPIRLNDGLTAKKIDIFSELKKAGVGVQVHYIPVYLQPYYKMLGFRNGLCPRAESFYRREISIPIYPGMNSSQIESVPKIILKTLHSVGSL